MVTTLCRDCSALAISATRRERCGDCGSPRQVHHAALHTLSIAHVDCDAFYATVEKRERPDLADRPVIIGGGSRGVVLACCYIARLDLSDTQDLHGAFPAQLLATLARRVEDALAIAVSIGLSDNKFLAKLASDLDKPRGFAVLSRSEAAAFLADKPVALLWGVGARCSGVSPARASR